MVYDLIAQSVALASLRKKITEHVSESEVREITFGLGIDFEEMKGQIKSEKIISVIEHCQHIDQLDELREQCKKARPEIDW